MIPLRFKLNVFAIGANPGQIPDPTTERLSGGR